MTKHRLKKVKALTTALALLPIIHISAADAFEVGNIGEALRKSLTLIPGPSIDINKDTNLAPYGGQDSGGLFKFQYEALDCDSFQTIFEANTLNGVFYGEDYERTSAFKIDFSGKHGLRLDVTGQPKSPTGVRALGTINYEFQSLDKLPDEDAWKCDSSTKNFYDVSIYINQNNSFVQISTPDTPLADVYTAPFNVGAGHSFAYEFNLGGTQHPDWKTTITFSNTSTTGGHKLDILGFDFSKFRDEIQVIGGRHYPSTPGFYRKGKNATAAFTSIIAPAL